MLRGFQARRVPVAPGGAGARISAAKVTTTAGLPLQLAQTGCAENWGSCPRTSRRALLPGAWLEGAFPNFWPGNPTSAPGSDLRLCSGAWSAVRAKGCSCPPQPLLG